MEKQGLTMTENKNVAIFLDRDGTIIEDRGHLHSPSEVIFYPGVVQALLQLQKYFLLYIITNQSGVAKGVISRDDVDRVNEYVSTILAEEGVTITDVYVCPHNRADRCKCIKPEPYFLKKAAKDFRIDLQRSFVIGDHPCDVQLAKNVGARGIYVLTGHGSKHVDELPEDTEMASGIAEAAEKIISYHLTRQIK